MKSVAALLLFAVTAVQSSASNTERLAGLQLARECRDAGDQFFRREGNHSTEDLGVDYLTHYNAQLGKCFIRITLIPRHPTPGASTLSFVYDAVDGFLIAKKVDTLTGMNWTPTSIMSGGDERKPTQVLLDWFSGLMEK